MPCLLDREVMEALLRVEDLGPTISTGERNHDDPSQALPALAPRPSRVRSDDREPSASHPGGTAHAGSWASVNTDGSLLKSRGVLANFHDDTGLYRIVFRKKLDNSVPVATMRGTFAFIRAYIAGNPGEVAVQVGNESATDFKDGNFNIALVC